MLSKIKNLFGSKFGKDVLVTIIGQIAVLLTAFGLNKLLSYKLGVVGFGEFSILKRVAGLVTFFMLAGIGIAIPKYLAAFREIDDRIKEARFVVSGLLIIAFLSIATISIIYVFRTPFVTILLGESGYEMYVLPVLLYAFSLTLTNFVYAYYRGLDRFYKYSVSQISVQLLTLLTAFIFGGNIISLFYTWSFIIGSYGIYICIQAWWHYYPLTRINSYKKDLKSSLYELVSFSFSRVPGELIWFSFTVVPLIIINHKFGMETTAYFTVATQINLLVTPFFSFVGLILLPLVSKSTVSNQFFQADQKVKRLAKIYFITGMLGIAIIELLTPLVINILFNSHFYPSIPIVRIIILAILPSAFYLLLRNPLDAASKVPYNTINLMISFTILNVLVLLSSSILALAISFVIGYGILSILSILAWNKCRRNIYSTIVKSS
ncbi:lipopolysaccharide biosynthesis protein [Bacillus litorisediminis]|uniref:lipopolysaccharide biosynthesis protein n=1 Tax=Bacillus litorisediminis TaxID=2922713 RepID=UPI001FB0048C|nr:oligosaccharide flippase family protein [Bacillus litorisediminis]